MWADLPLIVIRAIDEKDAENAEGKHENHHAEPIVPIGKSAAFFVQPYRTTHSCNMCIKAAGVGGSVGVSQV
jgi:hypothetical protein